MSASLSASERTSAVPLEVSNLDSGRISSQLSVRSEDWVATVAASLESSLDLNSPEWSETFGGSTSQFCFDDDSVSDGEEQLFDSNQRLPATLDRADKVASSAMAKRGPEIRDSATRCARR